MEIHLGTSIRWLYEQRQEQEKAVEHLLNVKLTLENQIEELIQDKNNLVNQLFEQPKSSHALSAIERRQLELLGINKVSDLINQYRFLLMQMSEMKPDKSRSGLSVSTRKDAVAQPGKAQIPSIVKPQSGTCFSKIGDQHEGRNNKVDEKSEVDRKQAVNVSHKRSSVAFIGYKPKRSRDFKGSPKRSYASVAAAKSSVAAASRSGPSAKAIKQCFVCGEVVHVAKDCPLRFVEKGKVDKVTQQYTVGGIAFEHAKSKDKNDANLELDALPFSACNAVGNDTVKAYVADVPATKKDTDLSENNSMMPLVGDDARHCDIFNCICVNKIEIVLDNVIVSQVKPYVKQKEPLSTVVTNDSSIREKPRQSGKEFRSFCNSSADQFQSTVTSILHQHQLNSQLKDISLNKVLQLESSKSDVLLKYGKQYRPIYDLIL
uniref:CCHC-type domain-containing protein n=1 Tax=Panagrolaimus superbus TaxID=310955 RepID=A0A914ZA93_9BILA